MYARVFFLHGLDFIVRDLRLLLLRHAAIATALAAWSSLSSLVFARVVVIVLLAAFGSFPGLLVFTGVVVIVVLLKGSQTASV